MIGIFGTSLAPLIPSAIIFPPITTKVATFPTAVFEARRIVIVVTKPFTPPLNKLLPILFKGCASLSKYPCLAIKRFFITGSFSFTISFSKMSASLFATSGLCHPSII